MNLGFISEARAQYDRSAGWTRIAIWLVLLSYIPILYMLVNRTFADFDIDGCSYQHLNMIARAAEGLPLYAPVDVGHQGISYTPLYWWICGFVQNILGPSIVWPRLVSLLFSLVYVAVIAIFVWRKTERNLLLTLAAPSMVLTTNYALDMQPWINELNVNPVHMAFAICTFFVLSGPKTVARAVAAGVLMWLCVLGKQTGLAYVAAIAFLLLLTSRKQAWVFLGTCGILLIISFLYLNSTSNGEFYRWTVLANRAPPWAINRLWQEVFQMELFGAFGIMAAMTLIPVLQSKSAQEFWKTVLTPEYVMCGAGIVVVSISQPKMGSGGIHAMIAFAGLAVCGSMGIHALSKLIQGPLGQRIAAWLVTAQLVIMLVPAMNNYGPNLIDQYDREKYNQISSVFQSGRTCVFGFHYLSKEFGQPWSGVPGDEFTSWVDGKRDYSGVPDRLIAPFRNQEFDYVIMSPYVDNADPVVKTIIENYKPINVIPRHPRGPRGGNMRYEHYILMAKRLLPEESAAPAGQGAGPKASIGWRPPTL